jgi:hypothetical protein
VFVAKEHASCWLIRLGLVKTCPWRMGDSGEISNLPHTSAHWPLIQVLPGVIADAGSQYSPTLPADIVRMLPELAAETPQPVAGDAEQLRFRLFDAAHSQEQPESQIPAWAHFANYFLELRS